MKSNSCYLSLACSIGSFSLACGSLLQLNSSDRISLQRGLFLTSLGFLYFISLTDFCNKYLLETRNGNQFRKKYHLMVSDVLDITNKIVSAVQAAFSCIAGFIVCKSSCSKSFLYASHFVMEAYAWFGTAYFMYDIWSMYKVHTHKIADKLKLVKLSHKAFSNNRHHSNGLYDKHSGVKGKNDRVVAIEKVGGSHLKCHQDDVDYFENFSFTKTGNWDFLKYVISHPIIVMHHIFIGTFGLLVVTYLRGGFGDCVYSFIYLMEFSTPFVSLRSVLSTLGLKSTRIYIINGLVMLTSFLACRILMWPYVFYWYSDAINRSLVQAIMGLPRGCKISIMILFLPQIYWFTLMFKGALKVFFPPKTSVNKKSDRNQIASHGDTKPIYRNGAHQDSEESNSLKRSSSPAKERSKAQIMTQGRSLM